MTLLPVRFPRRGGDVRPTGAALFDHVTIEFGYTFRALMRAATIAA
jgi:hypothetical protein